MPCRWWPSPKEEVVGHLLFSPAGVQGDARTILGMGLAPLAVRPEFQRQGIGTRLVEEGLRILREQGCAFVTADGGAREGN